MKRILLLTLLVVLSVSVISAQTVLVPPKSLVLLSAYPGYVTINEFVGGFGLGITDAPYAKGYFGITTIHGYQVNKSFFAGAGTGLHFYNEGMLVPIFADLRYNMYVGRFTPYAFADGGFLLDFSGKKDTRVFGNPGFGIRYTINQKLAINLGAGLLVQYGQLRDAYANIKTGVTYIF